MNDCLAMIVIASLAACGDNPRTDADFQAEVVASMHTSIAADLAELVTAAHRLQAAAPSHAWRATGDADAISQMRDAWRRTRIAYEHVEGATAPIFANLDIAMDARYDDFLSALGPSGDPALFDGEGVTGMHAIERILYAPVIRAAVVAFESPLPGYQPAAFPASDDDAIAFKTQLVQRLIDDATALHDQWQPAAIDIGAAYQGLVGLMNEQREKVNLAATGEEESRYADLTLFDLRNNLEGTEASYALFRDWVTGKPDGADADARIQARFATLHALYGMTSGDALPPVPATWSADAPTPADLATAFGMLWTTVRQAVDPAADGSIVFEMNRVATLLGLDQFVEGP